MGKDAYDRMLKEQYLLDHDSDSLYAYGRRQFDATVRELEQVAARIDPGKTWKELALEIKNLGPEPGRMIEAHQEWVDKAKAHVLEKKLVPIPWKERVEVVARAQFQRKNSYYGDFDGAKGPNAEGIWVGHWRINPFERCMDALLVSRDPEVMSGALCFRGTRVPVKNLFDYLEGSSTLEDFLEDFPSISRTTAVSVLEAARERLALDATAAMRGRCKSLD